MYRSGLCFFLSVIFRLINVADKVSISSSLTLYPSARWSVSWFPRLAESSYDDTLLKAEVLWLEIRRMPVTSFFWFLIKAGNDCRSEWHKKCAGRIGLPFMTEWLPTHFFLFISIYFFFFLASFAHSFAPCSFSFAVKAFAFSMLAFSSSGEAYACL